MSDRSLRIGINALYLLPGGVGGTETYLRGLLQGLARLEAGHTYVVYLPREASAGIVPDHPAFLAKVEPVPARIRPARILWEQFVLPGRLRRDRIEVLLNAGFTAPYFSPVPMVTLFHDLQHKRHPGFFRWFDLPFWNLLLGWAEKRSRLMLVTGEGNRQDLMRFYRTDPARIRITPLAAGEQFFELANHREDRGFLLIVSTLHPHKNYERALRAWKQYVTRYPGRHLVITGVKGFETKAVEAWIDEFGLRSSVRLAGWVKREELLELFRTARALLYPSIFEGFGLPVVEAMAAGLPVACSAIEPLVSIAGEAAVQFDPLDEGSIAEAIGKIMEDSPLRDSLAAQGREQAAPYRWVETARLTVEALEEAR